MADCYHDDEEGSRPQKTVPDAAAGAAGDNEKPNPDTPHRPPSKSTGQDKAEGRVEAQRSRDDEAKSPLRSTGTTSTSDQIRDAGSYGDSDCNDITGAASDVRSVSRAVSAPSTGSERGNMCSRPGSTSSRLSEFSLSDAEYMALILNDSLQLLKDLARWRKIYQLDDDVIAENAEKILAGDFRHLYSDLSPSQQATVRVSLERMRKMPEAELLKSLDTFPVRAPVA